MRRTLILVAGILAMALAACQDLSQPVASVDSVAEPSAEPSALVLQRAERVMPGRVLARLAPEADP